MRKFFVRLLTVCLILTACNTEVSETQSPEAPVLETVSETEKVWDDTPAYTVVEHELSESYEYSPMHIGTVDLDEELAETVRKQVPLSSFGTPIFIFRIHSYPEDYTRYWFPALNKDGATNIYVYNSTTSTALWWAAPVLNSLASLTSEETPLYIAGYYDCIYGIIGDTAYHLCNSMGDLPEHTSDYESLPAISTAGIDVKVVRLW